MFAGVRQGLLAATVRMDQNLVPWPTPVRTGEPATNTRVRQNADAQSVSIKIGRIWCLNLKASFCFQFFLFV